MKMVYIKTYGHLPCLHTCSLALKSNNFISKFEEVKFFVSIETKAGELVVSSFLLS